EEVKSEQLNEDTEKMSDSFPSPSDSTNVDPKNKTSAQQTIEEESLDAVDYRNEAQGSIQVKKQQDLCNPSEVFEDATATPQSPDEQANENSNDSSTLSPKNRNLEEVENNTANEAADMDFKDPCQLTCSLCEFSTDETQAYSEHVQVVHSNMCFECKFVAENSSQLFEHRQVCVANNMGSTSTATKPKTKSKKLVCKVCKDEASDEKEFYNHRRTHISPDKILECKFCPFVTQYKHHLDYHMKNHTGNKPFRCEKCEYSCVNKSMLNSHMKSHSNFYSYRCKDCNYEAKYMHALKCHCRKYRHDAMPVMNPDGTINPFPIVDVYGTRRGPKVKRDADGNIVLPAQYTAKIAMQPTKSDSVNSSVTAGGTMNTTTIASPSLAFSSTPFHQQNTSTNPLFNPYSGINSSLFRSSNPLFNTQPPSLMHNSSYLNSPLSPSTSNQRHLLESLAQTLPQNDSKVCHCCDQSFPSDELLQQHFILAHVLPRNSLVQDAGTPPRAPPRHESQSDTTNTNFITRILAARLANSALQPMSLLPPFIDLPQERDDPTEINEAVGALTNTSPTTPLDLTKDHTPPQQIMRRCLSQSPPDVAATSLTPPDTCSPPKKLRRSDHLNLTNRRLENIKEE
ncbi:Zinc finger C2H2-type, partial [Trinorchestia longiramus]